MKSLLFTLVLTFSSVVSASATLGEADLKDCECKTCLIENGVCVRTQTNSERYVPDKSSLKPKKSKKGSSSGAVSG